MRMIDFGPYFRSTVGFDRMFDMLENLPSREADDNYPPYNIEKTGEDTSPPALGRSAAAKPSPATALRPSGPADRRRRRRRLLAQKRSRGVQPSRSRGGQTAPISLSARSTAAAHPRLGVHPRECAL